MTETNASVSRQDSRTDLPSDPGSGTPGGEAPEQGDRTDPDPRLVAEAAQLATLCAGLAALRVQVRDVEKSLVERIADVDDDRRLTASQLQRSWQSQREDMEARVARVARVAVIGLALIAALGAGGLLAVWERGRSGQAALVADLSAARQGLERLGQSDGQEAVVKEKLADLSATVGRLTETLDRLAAQSAQVAAPASSPPQPESAPGGATAAAASAQVAGLEARVERIVAEQGRLAGELVALRGALAARAEPPSAASADAAAPVVAQAAEPAPEPAPEPADGQGSGQGTAALDATAARSPVPAGKAEAEAEAETNGTSPQTVELAEPRFAVQLMGSSVREQIQSLATRPELPSQIYVRQESRRGHPWYVLICGLYATRDEARTALGRLPPDLKAIRPWVRQLRAGTALEPIAPSERQ